MCSADCADFKKYMKEIYFDHKLKIKVVDPLEYLCLAELKYRTLYRKNKWAAVKKNPSSAFFGDSNGAKGGDNDDTKNDKNGW